MKNIKLPKCCIFKKLVIGSITLWFFSSHTVYSQYQSIFGQYSTEWIFEWHNLDFGGEDTVYVQKDTLVNGITWKRIGVKNNWFYYKGGLLREDTTVGKVWYKGLEYNGSDHDTSEILAFDFSLELNDSFDINNMYIGSFPYFKKVDTVYFVEGIKYIVFDEQYYAGFPYLEPYIFVEGVGGLMGVLWKQYFGGLQAQYLLCSYKDGIKTIYENNRYSGDCSPLTSSIRNEQILNGEIRLYPIPCYDHLTIEIVDSIIFQEMQIMNANGSTVYWSPFQSRIDISHLPSGQYYLVLQNNDFTITRTLPILRR